MVNYLQVVSKELIDVFISHITGYTVRRKRQEQDLWFIKASSSSYYTTTAS